MAFSPEAVGCGLGIEWANGGGPVVSVAGIGGESFYNDTRRMACRKIYGGEGR